MKRKLIALCLVIATILSLIGCGKNTVSVELTQGGNTPIQLIKTVQEITELPLKDAKAIVDNTPSIVIKDVTQEDAEVIKEKLEQAGGVVTIK